MLLCWWCSADDYVDGVVCRWCCVCQWCCVDVVCRWCCVDKAAGMEEEAEATGWSKKSKKPTWQCGEQEPHTKMWGKTRELSLTGIAPFLPRNAFKICFSCIFSKSIFQEGSPKELFFPPHRAYIAFKALHRCETQLIFSWDRHCQLRTYFSNWGLICLHKQPVFTKLSGNHFLILFQEESAFCVPIVPAILLALHGLRFSFLVNSWSTCRTETLRWPCR